MTEFIGRGGLYIGRGGFMVKRTAVSEQMPINQTQTQTQQAPQQTQTQQAPQQTQQQTPQQSQQSPQQLEKICGSLLHDKIQQIIYDLDEAGIQIEDYRELIIRNYKEYVLCKEVRRKEKEEMMKEVKNLTDKYKKHI